MTDKKLLESIISKVLEVITPDKIILLGSHARGDARPDSDYDLLVITKDPRNELKIAQDIYEKLYNINAAVDIIVKTPESLEKSRKRFVSVVKQALQEGIVVYE